MLYVLDINGMVKFGITSNWDRRKRQYEKELQDLSFQLIKTIDFEKRWQAELIEQVVKWRVRRWAVPGRHEWVSLGVNPVLGCISQVIEELEPEFPRHKHIHKHGEERWDFYRQIAELYFDNGE